MIVIQDIFSLLCVVVLLMTIYFLENISRSIHAFKLSKPKFSHGKRWTVQLSNDASSSYWLGSFQKLKSMIVQYFN